MTLYLLSVEPCRNAMSRGTPRPQAVRGKKVDPVYDADVSPWLHPKSDHDSLRQIREITADPDEDVAGLARANIPTIDARHTS